MQRIADRTLALLIFLPALVWWSSFASANSPPQFWQARSASVVVVDLPDIALFKRGEGTYVDLGYRFHPDGSGTWVGYVPSGKHERLDATSVGMMLSAAKLEQLPPVPARPSHFITHLMFYAMLLTVMAIVIRYAFVKRKEAFHTHRRMDHATGQEQIGPEPTTPEAMRRAMRLNAEKQRAKARITAEARMTAAAAKPEPIPVVARRGLQAVTPQVGKFGRRSF